MESRWLPRDCTGCYGKGIVKDYSEGRWHVYECERCEGGGLEPKEGKAS